MIIAVLQLQNGISNRVNTTERLAALRRAMSNANLQAYLIFNTDEHGVSRSVSSWRPVTTWITSYLKKSTQITKRKSPKYCIIWSDKITQRCKCKPGIKLNWMALTQLHLLIVSNASSSSSYSFIYDVTERMP